jgi:hypothetical protein
MNFPIVVTSARASAVSSGRGFTDEGDDAGVVTLAAPKGIAQSF